LDVFDLWFIHGLSLYQRLGVKKMIDYPLAHVKVIRLDIRYLIAEHYRSGCSLLQNFSFLPI